MDVVAAIMSFTICITVVASANNKGGSIYDVFYFVVVER